MWSRIISRRNLAPCFSFKRNYIRAHQRKTKFVFTKSYKFLKSAKVIWTFSLVDATQDERKLDFVRRSTPCRWSKLCWYAARTPCRYAARFIRLTIWRNVNDNPLFTDKRSDFDVRGLRKDAKGETQMTSGKGRKRHQKWQKGMQCVGWVMSEGASRTCTETIIGGMKTSTCVQRGLQEDRAIWRKLSQIWFCCDQLQKGLWIRGSLLSQYRCTWLQNLIRCMFVATSMYFGQAFEVIAQTKEAEGARTQRDIICNLFIHIGSYPATSKIRMWWLWIMLNKISKFVEQNIKKKMLTTLCVFGCRHPW